MRQHEKAVERFATPVSDAITGRSFGFVSVSTVSRGSASTILSLSIPCPDEPAKPAGTTSTLSPLVMKAYASSSSARHHGRDAYSGVHAATMPALAAA